MRPDTGTLDRHLSNLILAPAVNSLCKTTILMILADFSGFKENFKLH